MKKNVWICRDKQIEYGKKTLLMGIVNITPDSFSDGGYFLNWENAVKHSLQLIEDGADIIDLGAQSTRPGYTEISPEEEWNRLCPVLKALRQRTDKPISVDTYFPFVAKKALENGADILNDVSGDLSDEKTEIVRKSGAGWIITFSHSGAENEAKDFFDAAEERCRQKGIKKEQICFDMGIGFNKDYEENLKLIANIKQYKPEGYPLLLAASRKRVIGTASGETDNQKRIYGNIAAHTAGIFGGADILRVHDVKREIQGVKTAEELKRVWIK